MAIWAIADLHLALGVPEKHMRVFGPEWEHYTEKLENAWRETVKEEDLVLVPGDISWALHLEDAIPDLEWLGSLPGTKLLVRGNHDYWWASLSKIKQVLPASCHLLQNNSFVWKDNAIAGTRLWDVPGLEFMHWIEWKDNPKAKNLTAFDDSVESDKIYKRELGRLEMSLKTLPKEASRRIAMTHYPPIGGDLKETEVSSMLEKYGISLCVFGHLHNVKRTIPLFGNHHGIQYILVAADYLDFKPALILA